MNARWGLSTTFESSTTPVVTWILESGSWHKYPQPRIHDFDKLKCSKVFSKTALKLGYHQLCVIKNDIPKIVFLELRRTLWIFSAFKLTNAPALFMDLMNRLFKSYLDRFVFVFVDILIFYRSGENHDNHLLIILQIFNVKELYTKLSKCEFWLDDVVFVGVQKCLKQSNNIIGWTIRKET